MPRTGVTAPRQLGLVSATALVVANMIGTGVFTTSGFLLADLGSPWRVLLAWLVGGVVAGCGALSYGALAVGFLNRAASISSSPARCIRRPATSLVGFHFWWGSPRPWRPQLMGSANT